MESRFKKFLTKLVKEILDEDEELEEVTTTGDVDGYSTPLAFTGKTKNSKKRNKKISTNSTGYNVVKEELTPKDIKMLKAVIRDEVSNILRDIWLKRTSWK